MALFCYFDQKIILKNVDVTLIANILMLRYQRKENSSISFLDIKIRRVNNSFSTSSYCKLTFSEIYTKFESFVCVSYELNLIFTLLFRALKLCSNFELFHQEILNLKDIFKRNGYLQTLWTFGSKDF